MASSYKLMKPFDERQKEASYILKKYDHKVPIICEKSESSLIEQISKKKFLVNEDLTVAQFQMVIRKRLNIQSHSAIFLLTNNKYLSATKTLGEIYQNDKDSDGFLYIKYSIEDTFG